MTPLEEFPTARWHRPLYIALVAVAIAAVWSWPRVPTQDGPSHAYGLLALLGTASGDPFWSEHFALDWAASPNLGYLALGLPLGAILGAARAAALSEPAVVSAYLLLVALGAPALLRAFGRPALPLSFLALPLALNYPLFLGFHASLLGSALLLPAVGVLWRMRDAPLAHRAAITMVLSVLLALAHLVAGALALLAAGVLELGRAPAASGRPAVDTMARNVARSATVVALPLAFAAAAAVAGPPGAIAGLGARHPPLVLAWMLSHFGTVCLDGLQLAPAYAAGLWLALAVPWRGPWLEPAPRFLGALAIAIVALYFALPNFLASGAYLNERLPWLVPVVVLPLLRPLAVRALPSVRGAHARLLPAIAALWMGVTLAVAGRLAARVDPDVRVPAGSSVAVARMQPRPLWPLHDPWLHTGSVVARRSDALDLAFAHFYLAHYPLVWRHADWPALDDMHELYYRPREAPDRAWGAARFVVALDALPGDRAWLAARCRLVEAGGSERDPLWSWSVWRDCGPDER